MVFLQWHVFKKRNVYNLINIESIQFDKKALILHDSVDYFIVLQC